MAFVLATDLIRIDAFPPLVAGGLQPGLYLHSTPDAAATVAGAGYFNTAAAILQVGSVIISVTSTGTTPVTTTRTVTVNTGTVVTIA